MKIFISYASDDVETADAIAVALRNNGHDVFLDRDSLPKAKAYDELIRTRIGDSDAVIFLISPASVAEGRYTLTELKFAREKWPKPEGRIVPVMIRPTPMAAVPAYLASLNIVKPEGNLVAEVSAAVQHLKGGRGRIARWAAIGAGALVAGAALVFGIGQLTRATVAEAQADACAVVAELVRVSSEADLSDAAQRQAGMCRAAAALQQGDAEERQIADLLAAGDVEEALRRLRLKAEAKPQTAEKWARYATLARWRDRDGAIAAREAIVRIAPDDMENRLELAGLYRRAQRVADANAQAEEMLRRSDDPLADLLARMGLCDVFDIASTPSDWRCAGLRDEDVVAAYQMTKLRKEFASGEASGLVSARLTRNGNDVLRMGPTPELRAQFDRAVQDLGFLTREMIAQTESAGLKGLFDLRLKLVTVGARMMSDPPTPENVVAWRERRLADAAEMKAIAEEHTKLARSFRSPLVISQQASALGLQGINIISAAGLEDPANLARAKEAMGVMKQALGVLEDLHEREPEWGAPTIALGLMTGPLLTALREPPLRPVARECLVLMEPWARRLVEITGGRADARLTLGGVVGRMWNLSETRTPEDEARRVEALGLYESLHGTELWSDELAGVEKLLRDGAPK